LNIFTRPPLPPLPKGGRKCAPCGLHRAGCAAALRHFPVVATAALFSVAIWLFAPANIQAEPPADASVEKEFEEIFAQPEFRGLRERKPQPVEPARSESPTWLKDFFDWIESLFRGTGHALSGLGVVVQTLAYAVLAAVCALIIWLVVRAVNNYQRRQTGDGRAQGRVEEGEGEIPPGDLSADEYLRRAAQLAVQGLYREAIGQLILGAMSRTERSGLIRFRRGLTNRDYLRALRGRATQHQALRTIVDVYEPICFGRRAVAIEHYQTSLDNYQNGFQQPLPVMSPEV